MAIVLCNMHKIRGSDPSDTHRQRKRGRGTERGTEGGKEKGKEGQRALSQHFMAKKGKL